MTNGDPAGWDFLSHANTTNGFFFLLIIKYRMFMFKKRPLEPHKYAEMRNDMMSSLSHNNNYVAWVPIQPMYSPHVAARER